MDHLFSGYSNEQKGFSRATLLADGLLYEAVRLEHLARLEVVSKLLSPTFDHWYRMAYILHNAETPKGARSLANEFERRHGTGGGLRVFEGDEIATEEFLLDLHTRTGERFRSHASNHPWLRP